MNNNNNKSKPFFPLNYNSSMFDESAQLEKYYENLFNSFTKANAYIIHDQCPKTYKFFNSIGFLLDLKITQSLETVLKSMGSNRGKKKGQGIKYLDTFIYLDGKMKDNNNQDLTIRVVMKSENKKKIIKCQEGSFMLVHFFNNNKEQYQKQSFTGTQNQSSAETQNQQFTQTQNKKQSETVKQESTENQNQQFTEFQNQQSKLPKFQQNICKEQQVPIIPAQDHKENDQQQNNLENENPKEQKNSTNLLSSSNSQNEIEEMEEEEMNVESYDSYQQNLQNQEQKRQTGIQNQKIFMKEEFQEKDHKTKEQILVDEIKFQKNKYEQVIVDKDATIKELSLKCEILESQLIQQIKMQQLKEIQYAKNIQQSQKSSNENPIILD